MKTFAPLHVIALLAVSVLNTDLSNAPTQISQTQSSVVLKIAASKKTTDTPKKKKRNVFYVQRFFIEKSEYKALWGIYS